MRQVLFISFLSIYLIACSSSNESSSQLLVDSGPFITEFSYNVALSRKRLMPLNMTIQDSIIYVRGVEDSYEYKVLDVVESTPDVFEVIAMGGHTIIDEPEKYNIKVQDGIIRFHRLRNDAKWWHVSLDQVPSYEAELEKNGLIFHKSVQ